MHGTNDLIKAGGLAHIASFRNTRFLSSFKYLIF
jgi:hypothetical protein